MKTVSSEYLLDVENLQQIRESGLSINMLCDKCGLFRLVDREKDKVGETIGEVRGMNYHDGLAHYICVCGEPFDLYLDL